jgi:hypothetical protein
VYSGTVENSYSLGHVSGGLFTGGLVGLNNATITNSYWDTTTSGTANGIGGGTFAGAYGQTDSLMIKQSSYTGWDFTTIWTTHGDTTYPDLQEVPLI